MLKKHKHIIFAVLLLVLCLGIKEKMVLAIDTCLLPIFGVSDNVWLSVFFLAVSLLLLFVLVFVWLKKGKTLSEKDGSIILFFALLYAYFRIIDDHYVFESYFGSRICYFDPIAIIGVLLLLYTFVVYIFRVAGKPSEKKDALRFHRDDAIELQTEDVFDLKEWVDWLVVRLSNTNVSTKAYSIGIVGKWGEGKSSLMNLVEQKVKSLDKQFIAVAFNPRNSKSINNIQEDFLIALKQSLEPYKSGMGSKISKYAKSINATKGTPESVVWLMGVLNIHLRQDVESAKESITSAIKSIGKRIVVFVDDFDRLTGEEIMEVLKMIDKNCSFPNTIYLTAYDKDYVNRQLTKSDAVSYSDKYFNAELPLPTHLPSFIFNYFVRLMNDAVDRAEIEVSKEEINDVLAFQWILINSRVRTLRDVKRFVNLFLFYYVPMQSEVCFRDYLLLSLIRYAHPNEYERLYLSEYTHKGNGFVGSSSNDLWYLNNALFPSQQGGHTVPPSVTPKCLDILKVLFPTENDYQNWYEGRYKRIYSTSSYEYYFYNYESNHLKSKEIEELLSLPNAQDAFRTIDGMKANGKDLETALVTRNINSFGDVDELRRYFLVLLYSTSAIQSLYCSIQAFSFLRKDEVDTIVKTYGFNGFTDYRQWFENCLQEVSNTSPLVSAHYLQRAINGFYKGENNPDRYFMTLTELQNTALALLKDYVGKIDDENWSPETAFALSEINSAADRMIDEAAYVMYESMHTRFEKYTKGLVVIFGLENDKRASFVFNFHLRNFFTIDDFEFLLFDKKNDNAPEIEIVRCFWRLYKANSYAVFSLPKGRDEKDREDAFKYEMSLLERLESYENKIDALYQEWVQKRRLANVEKYQREFAELKSEVIKVPFGIELKEENMKKVDECFQEIEKYSLHAGDIDEGVVSGDFVRIRDKYLTKHKDILGLSANVLCYLGRNDNGLCQLRGMEGLVPEAELEAISIDGISDKSISYDPVVAASTGDHPIEVSRNRSYYIEQFENYVMEGQSYKEWVEQKEFQFVHEVQHWLREEFDEDLTIN